MPVRSSRLEIMDSLECAPEELQEALEFLRRTNRWFGGSRVILKRLEKFSSTWSPGETVRILDVGCGLADIPAAIAAWARLKGFSVHITGLEKAPQIAELARSHTADFPEIEILEEDIFSFSGTSDYVIGSLFLHHVPPGRETEVLQILNRIAARGIVLSDLERTPAGFMAVSLLSYLIGNRVVRHDGPLSVRRSLTRTELADLAASAGLPYLSASRELFFRMSLAGEKP